MPSSRYQQLTDTLKATAIALALVLVLSGASVFAASEDNPAQPSAHSEQPEQDLRVIDGDTLKIDGITYRMWGNNGPWLVDGERWVCCGVQEVFQRVLPDGAG